MPSDLHSLYPNDDTNTIENILDRYAHAYLELYGRHAQITDLDGQWILINGIMRERNWLVEETQRLYNLARERRPKPDPSESRSAIMRLIRRLSGL